MTDPNRAEPPSARRPWLGTAAVVLVLLVVVALVALGVVRVLG